MSGPYTHPDLNTIDLNTVLRALANPARLEIVRHLHQLGEASCAILIGSRAKSSISHHFHILRESGIMHTRIDGVHHRNTLRRRELDIRFPGLMAAILEGPAMLTSHSPEHR